MIISYVWHWYHELNVLYYSYKNKNKQVHVYSDGWYHYLWQYESKQEI